MFTVSIGGDSQHIDVRDLMVTSMVLHVLRDDLCDPINTVCPEKCFCSLYQFFTLPRQIIFGLKHQVFPQSEVRLWGDLTIMYSKTLVLDERHWQLSWKRDLVQEQSTSLETGNIFSPPHVVEGSLRTQRHQENLFEAKTKSINFRDLLLAWLYAPYSYCE